jgi:hypothetical protein
VSKKQHFYLLTEKAVLSVLFVVAPMVGLVVSLEQVGMVVRVELAVLVAVVSVVPVSVKVGPLPLQTLEIHGYWLASVHVSVCLLAVNILSMYCNLLVQYARLIKGLPTIFIFLIRNCFPQIKVTMRKCLCKLIVELIFNTQSKKYCFYL